MVYDRDDRDDDDDDDGDGDGDDDDDDDDDDDVDISSLQREERILSPEFQIHFPGSLFLGIVTCSWCMVLSNMGHGRKP